MRHLERRQRPRSTGVVGSATVHGSSRTAKCVVRDLSVGGVMLVGSPPFRVGERIEVSFDADGDHLTGMCVYAEVVRCHPLSGGRYALGVAFQDLSPELAHHIDDLVTIALEHQRARAPATTLVVDKDQEVCRAVARDLRETGMRVISASTPLDVIRCLHDPDHRIEATLVDACFGETGGLAILEHLAEAHPYARRILVVDRGNMRDHRSDLSSGRAHAFLTKPWERECLVAALFGGR